jgi:hypothetical protein
MPAVAKKQVAKAPPAADDPRAGLKTAIALRQKADAAVTGKREAVWRASEAITAAEGQVDRCRAAIPKGLESDVKDASTRLDKQLPITTPWHGPKAVAGLKNAENVLQVAVAAHRRLKNDLAELQDDASDAANNVLVEIKLLLLPLAQSLLDEAVSLKKKLHLNQRVLDLLVSDERNRDQPSFADDMRRMRAHERREAVFKQLRAETQHLVYGGHDDVLLELAKWQAVVIGLRDDPSIELPKA